MEYVSIFYFLCSLALLKSVNILTSVVKKVHLRSIEEMLRLFCGVCMCLFVTCCALSRFYNMALFLRR